MHHHCVLGHVCAEFATDEKERSSRSAISAATQDCGARRRARSPTPHYGLSVHMPNTLWRDNRTNTTMAVQELRRLTLFPTFRSGHLRHRCLLMNCAPKRSSLAQAFDHGAAHTEVRILVSAVQAARKLRLCEPGRRISHPGRVDAASPLLSHQRFDGSMRDAPMVGVMSMGTHALRVNMPLWCNEQNGGGNARSDDRGLVGQLVPPPRRSAWHLAPRAAWRLGDLPSQHHCGDSRRALFTPMPRETCFTTLLRSASPEDNRMFA